MSCQEHSVLISKRLETTKVAENTMVLNEVITALENTFNCSDAILHYPGEEQKTMCWYLWYLCADI